MGTWFESRPGVLLLFTVIVSVTRISVDDDLDLDLLLTGGDLVFVSVESRLQLLESLRDPFPFPPINPGEFL